MKIIVDRMPKKPVQCLFSERSPWGLNHYQCTLTGGQCEDTAKCKYLKERSVTVAVMRDEDDLK